MEQKNKNINKNQSYKVITFPLFIPLTILIFSIILFSKITTSTEVTSSSPTLVLYSSEQIVENNNNLVIEDTSNLEKTNNSANTTIETNLNESSNLIVDLEKDDSIKTNTLNTDTNDTTKVEKEVNNNTANKEKEKNKNTEKNTKDKTTTKEKTYTASNGEKYTIIGSLNIPSLKIKSNILSSTSEALMKIALNKYWGPNPNEVGNMVVVGHNYRGTKFFGKLYNIKKGDIVKITDSEGTTLDYKVYDTYVIDPYDNACTSQLTNGKTEITLITCYNNGKNRFVVKARAN